MKIKDLFLKPIDRQIEGVIKADDTSHLKMEVEEYVITSEIAQKLNSFFEAYNSSPSNTGVWISGFFGSGKSHLLKMLSLVLENKSIEGVQVGTLFEKKANSMNESILAGEIANAIRYDTESVLFNIDQKADVISKKENDAILAVFVKVFNELRGYYPKQPYIAAFEHELEKQGQLQEFKDAYLEETNKTWEDARKVALTLKNDKFSTVYAKVTGNSADQGRTILDHYRDTYTMSIEDFALEVNEYIESKGPNFRLNFFVDEVGQFIADNSKLMVNLQTIVETLSTKCKGRAWVLITSQEDLSNIVGEMAKVHNASDFSKIQDRFSIRPKLTSQNVSEVIQKRLLTKQEGEPEKQLDALFTSEHDNFKTLFDFSDGSRRYSVFEDSASFIQSYPFPSYQYALFQEAIKQLSEHNAFTGKHSSVGERSMLGVFQQVAKQILDHPVGTLATFDIMFEGLRNVIKTEHQSAILAAENHYGDPLPTRVLKVLYLVRYIKEFKTTVRNVSILVTDHFGIDIVKHQKVVQEALNRLEQETFVQRTGDQYQFLTNDEKDIENEIKATDVHSSSISDAAAIIIYENIIKEKKIHHTDSGNDYNFGRYLDGALKGREQELGIQIISPFNDDRDADPHCSAKSVATQQHMFVVLAEDHRFYQDIRLAEQTDKYIKHNSSSIPATKRLLLDAKAEQNRGRKQDLKNRLMDALGSAPIVVNGTELDIRSSDPKTRIVEGFQALVSNFYTQLKMLRTKYSHSSLEQVFDTDTDDLFNEAITEPETEIITFLKSKKQRGERCSVKTLLDHFSGRPYGWSDPAILTNTAKLFQRGKIELSANATQLLGKQAFSQLSNSHKQPDTVVELQRVFEDSKVKKLKEFHREFFNQTNDPTDPKEVAEIFISELQTFVSTLKKAQSKERDFSFVKELEKPTQQLEEWLGKDYSAFINDLKHIEDEWLDLKEDIMSPILDFVNGGQGNIYARAKAFYQNNSANKAHLEDLPEFDQIEQLLLNVKPYRKNVMKGVSGALDTCQSKLSEIISTKKSEAQSVINKLHENIISMEGYDKLTADDRQYIQQITDKALEEIDTSHLIAVIENTVNNAKTQGFKKQMNRLNEAIQRGNKKEIETIYNGKNIEPKKPSSATVNDKSKNEPTKATTSTALHISVDSISIDFSLGIIKTPADLEKYLTEVSASYTAKLKAGYQIHLS